ncbi:MAG: bifunctional 5,10-methylenetetrahydrofolate dehydrogenase/5,10-methenyltetrahydrofolate cyclohydrolase [Bacilli bacterium]|nr:bifunctional 5,10-methylenetetrahydrofolate dehydrogenase/5,10-methenyltetrahydrofolate cyclohydrolase [Bacilli bacterium]
MNIKEYVQLRKEQLKKEIASLNVKPTLIIIQVNADPASDAYVRGKLKDGAEVGANVVLDKQAPSISETDLIKLIEKYNHDPHVHGLIVQMPLPKQINESHIKLAVNPVKDVDGFHPLTHFKPCTPKGIIDYLKAEGVVFQGKSAVVIGRSNIVGKPMQQLLLAENATVTQMHSKTTREDMDLFLSHADIIVVAVGHKHFLNRSFKLKSSAVVVDVGINRDETGLHGDAEPNLAVKLQTPVPGGVGLLTRLSLLVNLMEAYHGIQN